MPAEGCADDACTPQTAAPSSPSGLRGRRGRLPRRDRFRRRSTASGMQILDGIARRSSPRDADRRAPMPACRSGSGCWRCAPRRGEAFTSRSTSACRRRTSSPTPRSTSARRSSRCSTHERLLDAVEDILGPELVSNPVAARPDEAAGAGCSAPSAPAATSPPRCPGTRTSACCCPKRTPRRFSPAGSR